MSDFYRLTRTAQKIVVVDLGFLGDTIHLVPSLWEIRNHYPTAALHVVTSPLGAEILHLAPCVDHPWAFPLGPPSPAWWEHWDIVRALRRERFDLALNFSGADRTVFLTALTGAKWRLSHRGSRRHFWHAWLIKNWISRQSAQMPVYEQRRNVLAACGFNLEQPRFDLRISPEIKGWAQTVITGKTIHLSINASTPLKEWPLDHWIELVRKLSERNSLLRFFASGSARPREQQRLQELQTAVHHSSLSISPPNLSITQLSALLSCCCLHVGADSGVLHLAMALGLRTMSVFRQYDGLTEWLPQGPNHLHLAAACDCLDQRDPPCLKAGKAQCLAGIAPSAVIEKIQPWLRD